MSRRRRHLATATALTLGIAVAATLAGCTSTDATEAASADATPTTVTVFAAASLTRVFDTLAEAFEARHPGADVVLSSGGSGALAQQIVAGAPADVFASAAEDPMQTVVDAGLAESPTVFATNTLQLVVPTGNPADVSGLDDLARPGLRVALCDVSVPCGAATADLLAHAGVAAAPDTLEADVTSVVTKVVLGEVDAAIVYRTDVIAAGDAVEGIDVPGGASVVNRYPIAVISDAANPDVAAAFVAFVTGADGRFELEAAGFGAP